MQQGVQVSEELVRLVRIEMLKESTGRSANALSPATPPAIRRCPKGFPGRRGFATKFGFTYANRFGAVTNRIESGTNRHFVAKPGGGATDE
jgi:hypothetical protein